MGKATGRQQGFGEAGAEPQEHSAQSPAPPEGGLTDSGREAYERALSRALRASEAAPRCLEELPEGEYGFRLHGDDGSEGLGRLSVTAGRMQLELPLDEAPFTLLEMPMPVAGVVTLELERNQGEARLRLSVRGDAVVRPGCVSLDLRLNGTLECGEQKRLVRRRLKGSADLRFGLA